MMSLSILYYYFLKNDGLIHTIRICKFNKFIKSKLKDHGPACLLPSFVPEFSFLMGYICKGCLRSKVLVTLILCKNSLLSMPLDEAIDISISSHY